MASKRRITSKKPLFGNAVSFSQRHTRRRWNLNLQKTTVLVDGKPVQVRMTAKEIKTLHKVRK